MNEEVVSIIDDCSVSKVLADDDFCSSGCVVDSYIFDANLGEDGAGWVSDDNSCCVVDPAISDVKLVK